MFALELIPIKRGAIAFAVLLVVLAWPASAQQKPAHDHSQHGGAHHDHSKHQSQSKDKKKPAPKKPKPQAKHGTQPALHAAPAHKPHGDHGAHDQHSAMKGFLGPYGMSREGSGTSWVPDTTPHEGIHGQVGGWTTMWHALFNLVYDKQGGPRGGEKTFVNGMVMGMAQKQVNEHTFGLRAMLSPDPFMGKSGYPLLLASGETADGKTHLIDRQHPHELFMELAVLYSRALSASSSVFLYAGLPGEPALGPPAFMHRTGGMDIPEAPITHHWLDSTHITFGVVTAGLVVSNWKIEASAFRGREPDQHRFDIEAPKLDSFSARLSWNPIPELSMQVSWGRLNSPEQLAPLVDEERVTASATYTKPFGDGNLWSSTAAWGRKMLRPGETLDAFLVESALIFKKTYTVFARAERIEQTELHHDVPGLHDRVLAVGKLSIGGIYDIPVAKQVKFGIGALGSVYALPSELRPVYGDPVSGMIFARVKVQ
jgi:hypothetical protein